MAHECCICYELINGKIDCLVTQCEHCFHTSCLMKNVALNGYTCPLCRRDLGKEDNYDDNNSVITTELYASQSNSNMPQSNETLVGVTFRNISPPLISVLPVIVKPTPAFITEKLIGQGVTMEQLVKALLKDHDEYEDEETEFINIDDDLFGILRIIISNYTSQN